MEEYSKRLEYEVCGSSTVLVGQYARYYPLVPFHLSFPLLKCAFVAASPESWWLDVISLNLILVGIANISSFFLRHSLLVETISLAFSITGRSILYEQNESFGRNSINHWFIKNIFYINYLRIHVVVTSPQDQAASKPLMWGKMLSKRYLSQGKNFPFRRNRVIGKTLFASLFSLYKRGGTLWILIVIFTMAVTYIPFFHPKIDREVERYTD